MTVEELIQKTDTLPPAPEVLPKLIKIMKDPDTDSSDIVQLISTDAAIMAGVLKLSNSGAYSPATPVTDLKDAVAMLGIKEVYRIVNLVSSGDYLDGALPSMDIGKGSLWSHSLAVALIMDQICVKTGVAEGLPYTLGLLHDIGKLGMHLGCGEQYVNVFKKVETERLSLDKAETETLGFDHAIAGSKMLEGWSFPEEVFIPIRFQYNPKQAPEEHQILAGALHLANWGAAVIGCNDGRDSWALEMIEGVFEIDQSELELAILNAREKLENARKALSVGTN